MGFLEILAIVKMGGYSVLFLFTLIAALELFFKKDTKTTSYTERDFESFCSNTNLARQKIEDKEFILPKVKNILENEKTIEITFESNFFTIAEFESRKEMFLNSFKKAKEVEITYNENREIVVKLYKVVAKEKYNFSLKNGDFVTDIFIGYDRYENPVFASLDKHCMIGGSTGFGKSSFLNALILNKLYYNKNCTVKDAKVEFVLVDLKGVEFNLYEGIDNINIAQTVEETIKSLDYIKEEIEKRKQLFKRYKVKNLEEYNKISNSKKNYIFVVIDEYACFQEMIEDKKTKEKVLSDLRQISSICRSFGIKLIVASQKTGVSAGAMDSFFRSQISSNLIIGFKVSDENTSKTIIFDSGLENLQREGETITIIKGRKYHLQTMYLSEKELKNRLEKDIRKG